MTSDLSSNSNHFILKMFVPWPKLSLAQRHKNVCLCIYSLYRRILADQYLNFVASQNQC